MCVTTKNEKYTCSCGTYKKICLCSHIIAVVKHRGPTHIANFLSQNSSAPSLSTVVGDENAGKKRNERGRKGGRTDKDRPYKTYCKSVTGDYTVIKRSRQTVCNGCKGSLISNTYVLRHNCAMPNPYKNTTTNEIEMRMGASANHHFHMSRCCVWRSRYHQDFKGAVTVDSSIFISPSLRETCRVSDLHIN